MNLLFFEGDLEFILYKKKGFKPRIELVVTKIKTIWTKSKKKCLIFYIYNKNGSYKLCSNSNRYCIPKLSKRIGHISLFKKSFFLYQNPRSRRYSKIDIPCSIFLNPPNLLDLRMSNKDFDVRLLMKYFFNSLTLACLKSHFFYIKTHVRGDVPKSTFLVQYS
jgi:hypothetical protein